MRLPFGIFSPSSRGRWWRRALVWLCLLVVLFLLAIQQVRSEEVLTPQEQLWSALLQQSSNLPQLIDDYAKAWMQQVSELQTSNELLKASAESLRTSNEGLTQQNGDLQTSLAASQQELATSETARAQLQSSLDDSMRSITQARQEADRVARELALWRAGAIVAGILAALAGAAAVLK